MRSFFREHAAEAGANAWASSPSNKKRNSTAPSMGTITTAMCKPGTLPASIISGSHSLKLPTIAKEASSTSSTSEQNAMGSSARTQRMGVSSVSPSWNSTVHPEASPPSMKSGQSESQSSGLEPTGLTSGRGCLRNFCIIMAIGSRCVSKHWPQKMPCPFEPPKPKEDTWLWPRLCAKRAHSVSKKASNLECSKCGLRRLK
mmetsp:Transcript_54966/g.159108  ORF Transcript_54966/g.159108 Transcript_54966/m.159108 type:complete len:201 (+) Transcript_54966:211-813(+)